MLWTGSEAASSPFSRPSRSCISRSRRSRFSRNSSFCFLKAAILSKSGFSKISFISFSGNPSSLKNKRYYHTFDNRLQWVHLVSAVQFHHSIEVSVCWRQSALQPDLYFSSKQFLSLQEKNRRGKRKQLRLKSRKLSWRSIIPHCRKSRRKDWKKYRECKSRGRKGRETEGRDEETFRLLTWFGSCG